VSGVKLDKKKCVKCGLFYNSIAIVGRQVTCEHEWVKLDKKPMSCQEAIRRHHELEDDECEHVGDGKQYGPMEWGASAQYKCIKCGEFYK
jgi:hypothetical protein